MAIEQPSVIMRECIAQLRHTADALDRMIKSTRAGSWSTNNVESMERERDAIYTLLGKYGL